MRVAYITHYLPDYRFGIFNLLVNDHKIEMTVFSEKENKLGFNFKEDKLLFQSLNSRVSYIKILRKKLYFQPDIIKLIIQNKFDIIILSALKSDISVWIGLIISKLLGRKIVLWGHCKYKKNLFDRVLSFLMLSLAKSIIFYSDREKKNWEHKKIICKKSFVARNTIIFPEDSSLILSNDLTRRLKDITYPVLIYSGRLLKYKQIDLIINAINVLHDKGTIVHLLIIGDGDQKEYLNCLTDKLKLTNQIYFLGPIFNETVLRYLYSISNLAVIPSRAGLSINQAFANRIPVITNDDLNNHGPEIDMVIPNSTGILYKKNDIDDLVDKLENLLKEPAKLECIGENAYNLFLNEFSPKKMVSGIFDAIKYGTK